MNIKHSKHTILDKGEYLLRRQGYHNTGINQILRECNIPKGSFYNFFKSKEEFCVEVLKHYGDKNLSAMRALLQSDEKSPLQRLKNFYRSFFLINKQEGFLFGCLINNFSLEISGLHEKLRKTIDQQYCRFLSPLEQCIYLGQQVGEIRTDYSAKDLSEYLHSNFMGVLNRLKSSKNEQVFEVFYRMNFDFLTTDCQ